MRSDPVLNKADMYRRLSAGEFGNTSMAYGTIDAWQKDPLYLRGHPLWGVRHRRIAGSPLTRLNIPIAETEKYVTETFAPGDFNISPMTPTALRWEGDVCRRWDGPGLLCSGNSKPVSGTWRKHMLNPKRWEGSAALILLQAILNENSYDDVMILLDKFPDHVVEFTALEVCYGTVEGRNAVVWECRRY